MGPIDYKKMAQILNMVKPVGDVIPFKRIPIDPLAMVSEFWAHNQPQRPLDPKRVRELKNQVILQNDPSYKPSYKK